MGIRERLSGNEAVAWAMRQINPDVMAAFPITPSTEIPQYFSSYVSEGKVDTVFVPVESEHSAMSACIGAEAAGARSLTATSSCGLALMWELLYIAASNRLPIAMALVNRALSGPININADHSDAMGARDSGWIQLFSENNQEAYDNFVQAYRIAEHPEVSLPVMVCQDGFITSHAVENIELLPDEAVKEFVGEYRPGAYLLNGKEPLAVGPYSVTQYYMEAKRSQLEAMRRVPEAARQVASDFRTISGRSYGAIEQYHLSDAQIAVVVMGSAAGAAKCAVDILRRSGIKAGLLKIRMYRPFPGDDVAKALRNVAAVACMDRTESFSALCGPLCGDVTAALYRGAAHPVTINYVYGLGGRDVTVEAIQSVYMELLRAAETGKAGPGYRYLSVRERGAIEDAVQF